MCLTQLDSFMVMQNLEERVLELTALRDKDAEETASVKKTCKVYNYACVSV